MVKFSSFPAFAAVLCAVLLFSCNTSDLPLDEPLSSTSTNQSSSVVKVSSSSSVIQSSSSFIANDPDLFKKAITLSYAGNSYADLDGNITTHKQAEVTSSRLGKIDLIAHCGTTTWCESNSIYTPQKIGLFWTDYNDFLGSEYVSFLEIPSAQAEVFKITTKLSEIESAYYDIVDIFYDEDNYLDEISIVAGKAFFVITSEDNLSIVIIKAEGNQSVDLEVIQTPF